MYEKTFDDCCSGWCRDVRNNLMFINRNLHWMNDRLITLGWISLNEVYESLGFPRELEAQVLGWKFTGKKDRELIEFETIEESGSRIRIIFKNIIKLI